MGTRRKGREAALQILYQMDISNVNASTAIPLYWSTLNEPHEGEEFANELVRGCAERLEEIDERIRDVSQHWRLERMTKVDRNILRLATYELLSQPDIPRKVTLNEAVELAKRYGSEQSPSFVNGVLDRIAGELDKS